MDAFQQREQWELASLGLQFTLIQHGPGIAVFGVSEPCSTVIVAHASLGLERRFDVLYGGAISQRSVSTTAAIWSLAWDLQAALQGPVGQVEQGVA